MRTPPDRRVFSSRARFVTVTTVERRLAPAEARARPPVSAALRRAGTMAPAPPQASSVRSSEPKFPTSSTWSAARIRGGCARPGRACSNSRTPTPAVGASVATTLWWLLPKASASSSPGSTKATGTPAAPASSRNSAVDSAALRATSSRVSR